MDYHYADTEYPTASAAAYACVEDYVTAGGSNSREEVAEALRDDELSIEMSAEGWTLPEDVSWSDVNEAIRRMRSRFFLSGTGEFKGRFRNMKDGRVYGAEGLSLGLSAGEKGLLDSDFERSRRIALHAVYAWLRVRQQAIADKQIAEWFANLPGTVGVGEIAEAVIEWHSNNVSGFAGEAFSSTVGFGDVERAVKAVRVLHS